MHGTGTALRDPAAIFRACQAKLFAQYLKERRIRFHLDIHDAPINIEFCHLCPGILVAYSQALKPSAGHRSHTSNPTGQRGFKAHWAKANPNPAAMKGLIWQGETPDRLTPYAPSPEATRGSVAISPKSAATVSMRCGTAEI
jgi:hypothetical protein